MMAGGGRLAADSGLSVAAIVFCRGRNVCSSIVFCQ